jgi:hypothetical protein
MPEEVVTFADKHAARAAFELLRRGRVAVLLVEVPDGLRVLDTCGMADAAERLSDALDNGTLTPNIANF